MGVMKSLFSGKQMSEAFICSAFLALSGGFQDAYTYNTRNEVFSNAQTGNVVLMSQNFMTGKWEAGLKYLFPLFAFALGVLIAEQIQNKYKYARRLHWRQGILGAEILILFVVGFIPQRGNMIATVLVSFACAMQVQSFRKANGFSPCIIPASCLSCNMPITETCAKRYSKDTLTEEITEMNTTTRKWYANCSKPVWKKPS